MDTNLWRNVNLLGANSKYVEEDARQILLNICDNILQFPENQKYREFALNDPRAIKILHTMGATECLFEIGFVEDDYRFVFPHDAPLFKLETLQKLLSAVPSLRLYTDRSTGTYILLPLGATLEEKSFFKTITQNYYNVLRYEDQNLQRKALKLIPIAQLEINAMKKMREFQKNIKASFVESELASAVNTTEEGPANDFFLCELVNWFKCKFFQWFDTPICSTCSSECKFVKTITLTNPQMSRIEYYKCSTCSKMVKFPRYSDPEKLLTSRIGRCGEWATVFTLFCRSVGYDARLVCDQTDHVWTEVWSWNRNQWTHVDPCENAIDQPLMYEKGWNKKLTYIIAYSKDEVQDVTWRYTRDQAGVMKRRKLCREGHLLSVIQSLIEHRQMSPKYSTARKQYVDTRRLMELAGMLHTPSMEKLHDDHIYSDRISGSYAWKSLRGEVRENVLPVSHTWRIVDGKEFELRYSIVNDVYKIRYNGGESSVQQKLGWNNGIHLMDGSIFRKVENDWQMVYLARAPGTKSGCIVWKFDIENTGLCISRFSLQAKITTFHEGEIYWEIEGFNDSDEQKSIVTLPVADCSDFHTNKLKGMKKATVRVTLTNGEGQLAWQHAQLFRQSLKDSEEESMVIKIYLTDKES